MVATHDENSPQRSAGTLGALLYADPAKPVVLEQDWTRLVQSMADRDQQALRELYERMHRMVYTLIVRITNDRETAEELTLDVFLDVWRRASTYDAAGGTVVGWVMNQARSRAIDRVRFEQRKKRVDPHPGSSQPEAEAEGPHQAMDVRQQDLLLRSSLAALTPAERQAIEATFFSGLTHAEAAARLNEPLGTIKTRIRSGLRKLRDTLNERGRRHETGI